MDNNNVANNIALDPNQMAPQDTSPLVQTGTIQPPVLDITPKENDFSVATPTPVTSPASTPTPIATPAPVSAPEPVLPVSPVIDITPVTSSPVTSPALTPTPIATPAPVSAPEPMTTAPIVTTGNSLADIISATTAQQTPQTPTTSTEQSSTPNNQPVTNPLSEDPNDVNTVS